MTYSEDEYKRNLLLEELAELWGVKRKQPTEEEKIIKDRIENPDISFVAKVLQIMQEKNMTAPDVYVGGGIKKSTFHKVLANSGAIVKKDTALQMCIGLKLNLDESIELLKSAGYAFSLSDKKDIIFYTYIEKNNPDIIGIDVCLERYGYPPIIV